MTGSLLEALIDIANQAAALVDNVYQRDFSVAYKGPRDPVTDADRLANDFICSRLARAFPDIPVVAEESDPSSFAGFTRAERVFFVDPVDGTREFVARNGEFAVMIGLLDGDVASHGVIVAPALGSSWAGAVGTGAFRIDATGQRTKIHVSSCERLERARVVASRSQSERFKTALLELGAQELIPLGSAGLKAAAVAEGRADLYVAPRWGGKRWDTCAGDAIVRAAGGLFSDASGAPLAYRSTNLDNDRGVVTAPPVLHAAALAALAAYDRRD